MSHSNIIFLLDANFRDVNLFYGWKKALFYQKITEMVATL